MKKTILIPFALLLSMHVSAQRTTEETIPKPVVSTFKTAYPSAEKLQWELDEENYMVGFVMNKEDKTAHYTPEGKWLRTETPVRVLDLPKVVKKTAGKNFRGARIVYPVKIESPDKIYYKMELTKDDLTYEVEITEAGEMTKHKEKEDPNKKEEEEQKKE
ncbi:MAG TPA: PepSY-like domain-containing protein [Bacteroidia bacterium]|jgi:hypothetical protein|nr:PepSY-like domain-containing protein [Bacteroidia bacterium]